MIITKEISRAARGLSGWTAADLASAAGVSVDTLRSFESGRTKNLSVPNQELVRKALETAGIQFIPENGGGAGVRMAKPDTAD